MSVEPVNDSESFFLDITPVATSLIAPFWTVQTHMQDETHSKIEQVAKWCLIAIGMIFTAPLALLGMGITIFCPSFRSLKGEGERQTSLAPTFFHINACMMPGCLPSFFGDQTPAQSRAKDLIEETNKHSPDTVLFSECSRLISDTLYKGLKESYTHFYIDIGVTSLGMENGLFVATRLPLMSHPTYHSFKVRGERAQWFYQRGFFAFETEQMWTLYTHLDPDSCDVRSKQLDEILSFISDETGDKPCTLIGDLNIDRTSTEYQKLIKKGFQDSRPQREGEVLDYMLIYPKSSSAQFSYEATTQTDPPLSDHEGLFGTFMI